MNAYMILGEDVPDSLTKRISVREEHLARITQLNKENRLILAGLLPLIDFQPNSDQAGFSGSLIVANFTNLQAAQQWAEEDIYVHKGIWARLTVKPFKRVSP